MGITLGTLIKRGNVWTWKFQADGRTVWKRLEGARSKRDAEVLRQAEIAAYHEDRSRFTRAESNHTLAEFGRLYFKWASEDKNLRARTVEMKRAAWADFTAYARVRNVNSITMDHVEGFKSWLVNTGPKSKPLSKTSANMKLRSLASMFAYGVERKWIVGNPAKGVKQYSVTETRRSKQDFLTREERDKLVEAAQAYRQDVHWFVLLCAFAGMRRMEAVNARWTWFDFDANVITIKEHGEFEIKDGAERTVAMHPRIKEALIPHAQADGYLLESNRPTQSKWRYRWDCRKALQACAAAAGVEGVTAQVLRITFGSIAVQSGIDIYQVSEWLGHSDVGVTRKHYAALLASNPDISKV